MSTLSRCEQTWVDGRRYFDRTEDAFKKLDQFVGREFGGKGREAGDVNEQHHYVIDGIGDAALTGETALGNG